MKAVQILLVEDSPADVELTRQALAEANVVNEVHVVEDGEAAIRFVRRQSPYAGVPRPDVVLLDLNLPKRDGRDVLAELKADPDLRAIPVVVLTTSGAQVDILDSYRNHASSYIRKPVRLDDFIDAVRAFERYWLETV